MQAQIWKQASECAKSVHSGLTSTWKRQRLLTPGCAAHGKGSVCLHQGMQHMEKAAFAYTRVCSKKDLEGPYSTDQCL